MQSSLPDSTTAYNFLPSFTPSPGPGIREHGAAPYSSIPSSTSALPRPVFTEKQSDDTASISSAKSLLDAERQLAEVRLAMLGMGKAMTEWMEVLHDAGKDKDMQDVEIAEAWHGLDRVRDTLLEAAGREVDELVRDWAWNDGLDTSKSRSSSSAPTPIEATHPFPSQPSLSPPPAAQEAQITPKAQTSARMQSHGALPAPPRAAAVPSSSGTGPQLHLSSQHDQPAPSLTRTLHHPRPSLGSSANTTRRLSNSIALDDATVPQLAPAPQPHAVASTRLASPPVSPSPPSHVDVGDVGMDMDPLAGIGVETIPLDARRRSAIFRGSAASGTATSPRMAVGSDPLGVHM